MTDAILVLCTCPDEASADLISEQLLNQRLAACINQLPGLTSVYRWQGQIERAREVWQGDRESELAGVEVPGVVERKCRQAAESFANPQI